MSNVIEIPLSKTKITFTLIGAIVFVILGIMFVLNPESFVSTRFRNPETIRLAGIASIAFFGLGLAVITAKLFDKKVGLRIDENGITDNSSPTSAGLIEWNDIEEIKPVQIASVNFLIVITDKPDKYIERAKNIVSKQAMKANYKLYGSPLFINSNALKMKFADLGNIVIEEFRKRNNLLESPKTSSEKTYDGNTRKTTAQHR